MKKSSLTAISIPEQAKVIRSTSVKANFSQSYNMKTGTIVKWSSGVIVTGYPAAVLALADGGPWAWVAGVSSAVMGLITCGGFFTDSIENMREHFSEKSAPIELGEWEDQKTKPSYAKNYLGIKVSQRSRRSLLTAVLHPMRPFRKILLRETIWYDPARDVFTRERSYLSMFNWVETQEFLGGRRRTFMTALNSVKVEEKE